MMHNAHWYTLTPFDSVGTELYTRFRFRKYLRHSNSFRYMYVYIGYAAARLKKENVAKVQVAI